MRATLLAAVLSCVALASCQPDLWAASSETVGESVACCMMSLWPAARSARLTTCEQHLCSK